MEETTPHDELLTHKAVCDGLDREQMSLLSVADDGSVTVCFDGDRSETARMSRVDYDEMTEGECWESIGFVTLE